jgi:hypothetical protein
MLHAIWTALIMKLPLILLVLAVWWAIHEEPEEPGTKDDDGGIRRPGQRSHPLKPFPRPPRRGPHGAPSPPSPPRIRTVHARARTYGR